MFYFFFFQAEDGIRDVAVTGVQTCALPISNGVPERGWGVEGRVHLTSLSRRSQDRTYWSKDPVPGSQAARRSEERRVGKECRSRWSPYQSKKKKKRTRMWTLRYDTTATMML